MTDVHSKETRSYNMSRIKSKNTKPEILVRKHLHSKGFRFRIHDQKLPGKPDVILPKFKTVIFIHGCFWHGHEGCSLFKIPSTNSDWWRDKIQKNIARDKDVISELKKSGWSVIVLWQCGLKKSKREESLKNLQEIILSEKNKIKYVIT